jgi:ribosomal protein L16 Arg81 hydroxylase
MTADTPLLRELIAPTPVQEFLDRYWPARHFATHGRLERLPPVFRAAELANLQTLAARHAGSVTFGKGTLSPGTIEIRGVPATSLYDMGMTVHLSHVEQHLPALAATLRQLEQELGLPAGCARASVFASPQADGVSCHFDAEDVFSIQLRGSKRFHVAPVEELRNPIGIQFGPRMPLFDDIYPQAAAGFPRPEDARFETVDMQPGSVLFMPRGTWHRTEADSDSLAVSLICAPPSAMECLLREMKNLWLQDPEWRRPLYGARAEGPMRAAALARARELLAGAPAIVGNISEHDLIARSDPERVQHIERDTRFLRNPDTRLDLEPGMASPVVRIVVWDQRNGEQTTLQTAVRPAHKPPLQWLGESRAAFSAGDLADRFPALSFGDHRQLLEALTRARFLKLLWFRPLSV